MEFLFEQQLPFVVVLRDGHAVWVGPGASVRLTRWRSFERVFSNTTYQTRYLREVIFGQRRTLRLLSVNHRPG